MKFFLVDKRQGQYTILKNTATQKTYEVKSSKLPPFLNNGDIIKKVGFKYEFDFQKTKEINGSDTQQFSRLRHKQVALTRAILPVKT